MFQFTPTYLGFAVADDDYCGNGVPHFPLPRGVLTTGPLVFPAAGVQQGIIIVGG